MNIVREHHEDLTSLIRVTVSQADYLYSSNTLPRIGRVRFFTAY